MDIISKTFNGSTATVIVEGGTKKGWFTITAKGDGNTYQITKAIPMDYDVPQVDILRWLDGEVEREVNYIGMMALKQVLGELQVA